MTTSNKLLQLEQRAQQAQQKLTDAYRTDQERIAREQAEKNAITTAQDDLDQVNVEKLWTAYEIGAAEYDKAINGELIKVRNDALIAAHDGQIVVAEQHVAKYRELAARINAQYVEPANRYADGALTLLAQSAMNKAQREGKSDWDVQIAGQQARNPHMQRRLPPVDTIEQVFSKWVLAAAVNSRDRRIRIGLTFATLGTTTGDSGVDRRLGLA